MILIGLTGNIASGKSEVARMLADRGATIIDADVLAREAVRPERLVNNRGLEETEAMNMIAAQMPAELKRARADHCIDNNGSLDDLERDVDALWSSLQRNAVDKVSTIRAMGTDLRSMESQVSVS